MNCDNLTCSFRQCRGYESLVCPYCMYPYTKPQPDSDTIDLLQDTLTAMLGQHSPSVVKAIIKRVDEHIEQLRKRKPRGEKHENNKGA